MENKISAEDFINAFGGSVEKRDNIMSYPAAADVITEFREKLFDTFPEDVKKALALAIMVLASSSNDGWIPVSERLPEGKTDPHTNDFEIVLCTTIWEDVRPYRFGKRIGENKAHFWLCGGIMDKYITAWQPLPEPYKRGDDDEQDSDD